MSTLLADGGSVKHWTLDVDTHELWVMDVKDVVLDLANGDGQFTVHRVQAVMGKMYADRERNGQKNRLRLLTDTARGVDHKYLRFDLYFRVHPQAMDDLKVGDVVRFTWFKIEGMRQD